MYHILRSCKCKVVYAYWDLAETVEWLCWSEKDARQRALLWPKFVSNYVVEIIMFQWFSLSKAFSNVLTEAIISATKWKRKNWHTSIEVIDKTRSLNVNSTMDFLYYRTWVNGQRILSPNVYSSTKLTHDTYTYICTNILNTMKIFCRHEQYLYMHGWAEKICWNCADAEALIFDSSRYDVFHLKHIF